MTLSVISKEEPSSLKRYTNKPETQTILRNVVSKYRLDPYSKDPTLFIAFSCQLYLSVCVPKDKKGTKENAKTLEMNEIIAHSRS